MPQVQPPEFPQNDFQVLVDRVSRTVFREKLARDWNVVPQTAHEEEQLYQLAEQLRAAHEQDQIKSASAGNHFLDDAVNSLGQAMGSLGYVSQQPPPRLGMAKAAAAQAITQDPELAQASWNMAAYLDQLQAASG